MGDKYIVHLRKSRADVEAEALGEGETLAKHERELLCLAENLHLNVVMVRRELVTGESLVHRPQMLETLKEVEAGLYEGVLCMDIDRLGRGDMEEQGLILKTFKSTNTKIITPRKIYDLNDEFDEEYSEFEAFMARKELKIITRRLQRGRIRSVKEGNYLGPCPPYGYTIVKDVSGRYLVPHPEQAPVVKMIFEMYTNRDPQERRGACKIANELNLLGYRSYSGKLWKGPSVLSIIKNAVYAGRIQWKKREERMSTHPGKKKDTRTRPEEEWIDVEGKHEPLISQAIYDRAQEILEGKYHVPYQLQGGITNPLAGLVICGFCGLSMVYRPYAHQRYPHLICYNRSCQNKSARFEYVEGKMLQGLELWLKDYKAKWAHYRKEREPQNTHIIDAKVAALQNLKRELAQLNVQRESLHDLLEQGIYDRGMFLERSENIRQRLEETSHAIAYVERDLMDVGREESRKRDIVPKVEHILKLYYITGDPSDRNALLKTVLDKAIYRKEKYQRNDNFTLTLYPKLPGQNTYRQ